MQLIACSGCQRQYDVTNHPVGQIVRCICDDTIEVAVPEPHAPRPVRCSSCGAALPEDSRTCGYCTSEVTLEEKRLSSVCPGCFARMTDDARFCMECGIAIEPQALIAVPEDSSCPRCESGLRSRAIGSTSLIECLSCAGLWLTPTTFDQIRSNAEKKAKLEADLFKNPQTKEPQKHDFRYLRCVVCRDLMVPRNYGGDSGVLIDICRDHGVWLDHSELEKIVAYVRSGKNDLRNIATPAAVSARRARADRGRAPLAPESRSPSVSGIGLDVLHTIVDLFTWTL